MRTEYGLKIALTGKKVKSFLLYIVFSVKFWDGCGGMTGFPLKWRTKITFVEACHRAFLVLFSFRISVKLSDLSSYQTRTETCILKVLEGSVFSDFLHTRWQVSKGLA